MARGNGFHIIDIDADEQDNLSLEEEDDFPEWEPEFAVVPASTHTARTLGATVSAGESTAMHRVAATSAHGFMVGMNNVHCDGCRERPWPDCACCGAIAVIALPDPDESVPHSLSLCARCWGTLLAVRTPPPGTTRREAAGRKGGPFTPAELARITYLREVERLSWVKVGARMGTHGRSCNRAYDRMKDRERWEAPSPRMVSSRPDTPRNTRNPSPTVVTVPKTRQRPAQSARSESPQNHLAREPLSKRNKRTASPVVRPPLIVTGTATAAAKTASGRKYNTAQPGRVKRAMRRRATA